MPAPPPGHGPSCPRSRGKSWGPGGWCADCVGWFCCLLLAVGWLGWLVLKLDGCSNLALGIFGYMAWDGLGGLVDIFQFGVFDLDQGGWLGLAWVCFVCLTAACGSIPSKAQIG